MAEPRFHAAPADALRLVAIDGLVAAYHRPSGQTHLLGEPAPEIIVLLQAEPLSRGDLLWRLGERYDVADAGTGALAARLEELAAAGLIHAA